MWLWLGRKMVLWVAISVLLTSSCGDNPCQSESPIRAERQMAPGYMNLAVLVLDFQTYAFEGGNLSYYRPCDGSCPDSLPFDAEFRNTWDFASVLFRHSVTGDTLFEASVIWMGHGRIKHPATFAPPDSFRVLDQEIDQPSDPERFQFYPRLGWEELIARTDSAWVAVSALDITHCFAEEPFRVGYYFYAPTVGLFDPSVAKWIIFLYWGGDTKRLISGTGGHR